MRSSAIVSAVAVIAAAATLPGSARAADAAVVPLPFRPAALNNNLQVVGRSGTVGDDAVLWANGVVSPLASQFRPALINDDGFVLGSYNGIRVIRAGVTTFSAAAPAGAYGVLPGGLDVTGRVTWASFDGFTADVHASDGTALGSFAHSEQWRAPLGALDGAIVTRVEPSQNGSGADARYFLPGSPAVTLPGPTYPMALGPEGKIFSVNPFTLHPTVFTVDPKSGAVTAADPGFPTGIDSFTSTGWAAMNAKGRILIETTDDDVAGGPNYGNSYWRALHTYTPGTGWSTITEFAANGTGFDPRPVAVNGWGDMLVEYQRRVIGPPDDDGQPSEVEEATGTGALIRAPRAPLTGIILVPGAGGREPRAVGAGMTVTLTGGPVPLTATAAANGTFAFAVPEGSYTVTAPAGACIEVANGCHSSVATTVAADTRPVVLAKTTVAGLATFAAKRGAKLKPSKAGVVSTGVRCSATVTCSVRLTLKRGRKSYGTVTARVLQGKTKAVGIALNRAGKDALAATRSFPVTIELVVTAAPAPKLTVIQGFTLNR